MVVTLHIRLDWSEMDMFQHINNVSYFKFTQANRINILEQVGLIELHQNTGVGPTLGHTSCQFIQPLFFPGNITVKSYISAIKTTSFVIIHEILNDKNELCAKAEDVLVVYDYKNESKQTIPSSIKKKLASLMS